MTTREPFSFILVGLVSTQVDDPAGVKVVVDDAQKDSLAETCVTGDGVAAKVGVEGGELEQ